MSPRPVGLSALLQRVDDLKVFPAVAHRVMRTARRHDASLRDMREAVASDPVLAGRVVKMANSPLYARATRIDSLDRAIQVLGFEGTRDVALALALSSVGSDRTPWGQHLWVHARAASIATNLLARYLRRGANESAFVIALLHDLGRQLMVVIDTEAMNELMANESSRTVENLEAEVELFGVDHAALGAACLQRWGLPGQVADVVASHHLPPGQRIGSAAPRDVALLRVADRYALGLEQGTGSPECIASVVAADPSHRLLGLRRRTLEDVAERLLEEAAAESLAA